MEFLKRAAPAFEALFIDECYVEEFLYGGVAFGDFVVDDVAGELFHRDVLVQGRGVVGVEDYEFFAAEVVFCEFVEAGRFGGGVGRGGLFCRSCDFPASPEPQDTDDRMIDASMRQVMCFFMVDLLGIVDFRPL